MALTLEQLFENMKRTAENKEAGDPLKDVFNRAFKSFDGVANSVKALNESIKIHNANNQTARLTGAASDVQSQIRELLQAKIMEDQIESERNKRMMDMAERLVPQVTDEQLKAIRMQQLMYREHQKTLEATLDIEKKKAEVQKQAAQDMANRQIATLKDKYGTIESAVASAETMAQDPLTKFLVQGLGRFVKEKKEDPQIARANQIAENKKAFADKTLATREENIKEDFEIRAAKNHIADPGSASKLYAERDAMVKKYAELGASTEKGLRAGKATTNANDTTPTREVSSKSNSSIEITGESATALQAVGTNLISIDKHLIDIALGLMDISKIMDSSKNHKVAQAEVNNIQEIPELTRASVQEAIESADIAKPKPDATTVNEPEPKKAPKNAKFGKAPRQSSPLLTPVSKRTPQPVKVAPATPLKSGAAATAGKTASVGAFGSKAGAVNVGAIGSALGSISTKLGTLASSSLKFLGPWGLVANVLLSFNRLVPIISDGVGALLDLSKLVIPFGFSMLVESFNGLLSAVNTIVQYLDRKWFGANKIKEWEDYKLIDIARGREEIRLKKQEKAEMEARSSGGSINTTPGVINTTSIEKNGTPIGKSTIQRQETRLTSPREEKSLEFEKNKNQDITENKKLSQEQSDRDRQMRDAVIAASKTPGTTPVYVKSPYLEPWYA